MSEAAPQLVAALTPNEYPRVELLIVVEAECRQVLPKETTVARREAERETLRVLFGESTPLDIDAGWPARLLLPQLLAKELAGGGVDLPERLAWIGALLLPRDLAH